MTNLHDGQIADLLNNAIRYSPEIIAMGYAIREEKRRIMALAAKTRLMAEIDSLSEKALDYLAVELRTPAYSDAFPMEIKRNLIKGTLPFYARLGTPAAVNWLITTIFGSGSMEDWFEYNGDPHHFRANVGNESGMQITPENLGEFRRMISSVKRLSSWLDDISVTTEMDPASVYLGGFLQCFSRTRLPNFADFDGGSFTATARTIPVFNTTSAKTKLKEVTP